jgi:hypothetical protein
MEVHGKLPKPPTSQTFPNLAVLAVLFVTTGTCLGSLEAGVGDVVV